MSFDLRMAELNKRIKEANKIVFFGGAGVSTASGIPDFRSKDGLYNTKDAQFEKYTPEYLLSATCLYQHPKVFYEFYRQKLDCRDIEPNVTHYKLAEMEAKGKLSSVITQNIDGLHQKAGSKKVYEIHGTTLVNYCTWCHEYFDNDHIFTSSEPIPRCECGGMVRPDVTLYEEMLPQKEWEAANTEVMDCDLLIVAGTSLTVYPANSLLNLVRDMDKLVLINRDETGWENKAGLVFHEDMTEVFSRIEV